MALEIIGYPGSNFVRTLRMLAHEKGISYELVNEMPHSDMVKSLHPMGQIPAMRHDGFALFESIAIARYLESVFDGRAMIPADPRSAGTVMQWSSFAQTTVDRIIVRQYVVQYLFNKDDKGNVVRDGIDRAVRRFPKIFRIINNAVSKGCVGGNEFTMADCFLLPILSSGRRFPECKEA